MFELNNKTKQELIKYSFNDGAFWEAKYYKYVDVSYIYEFLKQKVKTLNVYMEGLQHSNIHVDPSKGTLKFYFERAMDAKNEIIYTVSILFSNGIANEIIITDKFNDNRFIRI